MYSMPYIVGRMFSNIRDIYNDINAATLTGAIDVVVIEQPDGSFNCSPFHVRFGKLGVLRSREKIVDILINDEPQDIYMKLGESGEAFFVEEIPEHERHLEISEELSTSPLPTEHDQSLNFHSFSENNLLSKDMSCVINEDSQTIRRNTDSVLNGLRDSSDFIQETILKKSSDDINDDETISNDLEDFETLGEISDQTIDMYCEQNKTVNNLKKKKRKKGMVRKKKSTTSNDSVTILNSSDLDTRLPKVDPEIHFFSDTEINSNTRPSSPVQSDSELEVSQRRKSLDENDENSWAWGQLPKVQTPKEDNMESSRDKNSSTAGSTKDKKSMLSSVFSFMRHSRKSSNEGLYLADLSSDNIDPAVLAKYFPDRNQPISMLNDDCESGNGPSLPQSPEMMNKDSDLDHEERDKTNFLLDNITLSLCGWQQPPNEHAFLDHIITYSEFMKNPLIIESNDLVVRILDEYYHWSLAAPMILSMLVFKKPLPKSSLVELNNKSDEPELQHHDNDSPKPKQSSSWWSWRRKESNYNASLDSNTSDSHNLQTTAVIEQTETKIIESGEESSHYEVNVDHEKFRKTLRLTSAQIESLHLKQGRNKVVFSVTTAYQGTSRCKCFIYRWRYDDKIVVSDIDGTITKSDVLGHILPIVGKDWAQTGVAQLFTKIKNNGYKLLYLSARAIGQSRLTRDYLQSIKQDDLTLPDGPILLNPTSLLTAFHGEVIEKKPEKFKISCLSDISALFPAESHPFYAGYGNKVNDVWSYRSVSIPIERIFTINHKGELKHELSTTFRSSYTNMSSYVDELFPPLKDNAMDYSHFLYWRDPLPEIDPKQIK